MNTDNTEFLQLRNTNKSYVFLESVYLIQNMTIFETKISTYKFPKWMTTISRPKYRVFFLEKKILDHRLIIQKNTRLQHHLANPIIEISQIKLQPVIFQEMSKSWWNLFTYSFFHKSSDISWSFPVYL